MKYEFVFQLFYDTLMIDILLLYPICQFIMYMIMVSVEKYRYPQKNPDTDTNPPSLNLSEGEMEMLRTAMKDCSPTV